VQRKHPDGFIFLASSFQPLGNLAAGQNSCHPGRRNPYSTPSICDEQLMSLLPLVPQLELLKKLARQKDIPWNKVNAFHFDEYVGMPLTHPASFRNYLWGRFVSKLPLPLAGFHYPAKEYGEAEDSVKD